MNRLLFNLKSFAALLAIAAVVSGAARAADLSQPVILVASSRLDHTPFQQAVILATPLDDGGHIGFIINKPTGVKLQELFPDDRAAGKVKESVYLGGPAFLESVFALTRSPPESADAAVPLMPGLFAVMDSDAIDRIIANTPNEARFYLGMMVWKPGALEEEVRQSACFTRPMPKSCFTPSRLDCGNHCAARGRTSNRLPYSCVSGLPRQFAQRNIAKIAKSLTTAGVAQ